MEAQGEIQTGLPDSCLLLGGQPRSGTSLLTSILRAAPRHFQAFELHIRKPSFLVGLDGRYTRNIFRDLGLPNDEFDSIIARCDQSTMNLGAWCGPKEDISAEPLTGAESEDYREEFVSRAHVTSLLMRNAAARDGAESWGFKILSDVVHADLYRHAWSHARFILLIRDPRDQAASLLKLNEQRSARNQANFYDDYVEAAAGWRRTIEGGRKALVDCGAEFIEVRYEDLVQSPTATMASLSEFVGIDLSDGLQFHRHEFIDAHLKRFKHHDNLRNPVSDSSVGRWRTEMDERDASVFEDVAGDLMETLGYA